MDMLPQDQLYHSYMIAGTLDMTTSTCKHAIILPTHWYAELLEHFPDGINVKTFYDRFLANVTVADRQASAARGLHLVETCCIQELRRNIKGSLWAAGVNPTGSDTRDPYQM